MSNLRLLAEDEEDLKIISAHLQDAVMRVGDIAYLPKRCRFALLLNRFCWEQDCGDGEAGVRVLTGLHFDGVLKVQVQNLRRDDPAAVAALLAIDFTPDPEGGGMVDLLLAGGGCIRLYAECIDATLRDITPPRAARARPEHALERGQ